MAKVQKVCKSALDIALYVFKKAYLHFFCSVPDGCGTRTQYVPGPWDPRQGEKKRLRLQVRKNLMDC